MTWKIDKNPYTEISPASDIIYRIIYHNTVETALICRVEFLIYKNNFFQIFLKYEDSAFPLLKEALLTATLNPFHFLEKDYIRAYTANKEVIELCLLALVFIQTDIDELIQDIRKIFDSIQTDTLSNSTWLIEGSLKSIFYYLQDSKSRPKDNSRKIVFKNVRIECPISIISLCMARPNIDVNKIFTLTFCCKDSQSLEAILEIFKKLELTSFNVEQLEKKIVFILEDSNEIIQLLEILNMAHPAVGPVIEFLQESSHGFPALNFEDDGKFDAKTEAPPPLYKSKSAPHTTSCGGHSSHSDYLSIPSRGAFTPPVTYRRNINLKK